MYYIGITGYASKIKSLISFKLSSVENKSVFLLQNTTPDLPITEEIALEETSNDAANPEIEEWKIKISQLLEKERSYENPNLTLQDIARKLNTNQTVISKMVNQGFKMNFNDFINSYRIEAIIDLFKKEEHKKQTILGISIDCGFNSKTTFNRCFKKQTGLSPKEYLEKLPKKQPKPEDFKE